MGYISEMLRDIGTITLDVDLRTGDFSDKSQYNNVVSVVGTPTWSASEFGWGLGFAANQYLAITPEVNFTNPKSVAFISQPDKRQSSRVFSRRDDLEVYVDSSNLTIFNGAIIRQVASGTPTACVIVPSSGFSVSEFGLYSFTAMSAGGLTSNSYVGNSSILPASGWHPRPIYKVMLLNRVLSSVEAQTLLQELLTERFPTRSYSYQRYTSTPKDPIGITPILKSKLEEPVGRIVVDSSPNGKNGTLVGACFKQSNGLYVQGGTAGYINFGNITALNSATKATIYIVADPRNDGQNTFAPYISRGDSDESRIGIYHGSTPTTVQFSVSNGTNGYKQQAGLPNKLNHLCLSYDGSRVGAGERVHTYIDGKKVASTLMADFPASLPNLTADLRLGQFTYETSSESRNKYKFVGIYPEALNEGQVRDIYKQFSKVTSRFDFRNVPSEIVTYNTSLRSIIPGIKLNSGVAGLYSFGTKNRDVNVVADGDMEAVGTASWTQYNTSTLSKQPSDLGTQCLRIVRNGGLGGASQTCLVVGKLYRIKGKARSGTGTDIPAIGNGDGLSNFWYGTNSTSWQDIDVIIKNSHATLFLTKITTGNDYVEFDNITVQEIVETTTKAITKSAGADSVLYWNDLSFGGTRRFNFYNNTRNDSIHTFSFGICDKIGIPNTAAQNAYWIRVMNNVLYLTKSVNAVVTDLATFALSNSSTWYDIHWSWEFDGTHKVWIKDHSSNNWIAVISVVDTSVTSVKYGVLYIKSTNAWITDEIITNEIALSPEEWDGV